MADTPTDPELQDLFREAAEIAAAVPESMHGVAFSRALDELMRQSGRSVGAGTEGGGSVPETSLEDRGTGGSKERLQKLMKSIDRTKYPDVTVDLSALDRALRILAAAKDHGADGLTPSEISQLLTDKFRVATTRSAVGMALGGRSATALVDRTPEGAGYLYRLMDAGERRIAQPPTTTTSSAKARKRSRKRAGVKTTTTTTTAKASGSTPEKKSKTNATRRATGRPGPKGLVEGLITQGFFDQPRTLSDVIDHVKATRGHTYKVTDLSSTMVRLLRDDVVTRSRNDKKQYEYTRAT